ncbi:hypothetical protein PMAYCL1PPCAC_19942, partial [Pristionchus mayeri]
VAHQREQVRVRDLLALSVLDSPSSALLHDWEVEVISIAALVDEEERETRGERIVVRHLVVETESRRSGAARSLSRRLQSDEVLAQFGDLRLCSVVLFRFGEIGGAVVLLKITISMEC